MGEADLLESMRRDLRFIRPALERDGWTKEEILEISAVTRSHQAAGNEAGLRAMAQWLRERAGAWLAVVQADYDRARAGEKRAVPTLGYEAERRIADKHWMGK